MDRFAEKQARIVRIRAQLITDYPALWDKITREWKQAGADRAWLPYSALRNSPIVWVIPEHVLPQVSIA